MSCYHDHDNLILKSTPGLFLYPLYPIGDIEGLIAFPEQWRAVWITVDPLGDVNQGRHPIEVSFEKENGECLGKEVFELEVIGALVFAIHNTLKGH
ncbi:hypothetical protein V7111_05285 [Neobacillus niacini]|uniref:hypothetical protein n=1 Tax=Neobacillus niacini TaxID=86668 RepID=UPI002FFF9D00